MTTIREETPRSAPLPTLSRTLPAKVRIIRGGNGESYLVFLDTRYRTDGTEIIRNE